MSSNSIVRKYQTSNERYLASTELVSQYGPWEAFLEEYLPEVNLPIAPLIHLKHCRPRKLP